MVLVAVGQICSTNSVAHNISISMQVVRDAAAAGAKAVFLPEASDYISLTNHEAYLLAEPLSTHTYTSALRATAKELGVFISVGIHELPTPEEAKKEEPGSERVFNTHIVIGPDGEIASFYRKLHLFDIQLKSEDSAVPGPSKRTGEHLKIIPGDTIAEPVSLGSIGKLGLEICYDIRFPELHIILRRKGADIIAIPSAFTVPTGRAHWAALVRSIAISYQVYVVAAAQAGAHNPNRSSWGEALAFDPWGTPLGRLPSIDDVDDSSKPLPPQFMLVDVDQARVEGVREQIPLEIQKRDDVYGVVGANALQAPLATISRRHSLSPETLFTSVWNSLKALLGYRERQLDKALAATEEGKGKVLLRGYQITPVYRRTVTRARFTFTYLRILHRFIRI
ncbi:Nitrilase-like protein [Mycena indigotica]|uniref:Nitrilase-like protein n=1 Tax=Mycena indigotica TaxID=2126181 RepID=A0A8H6WAV9_9AGAR|nr:Nitrilase-like protein [Mycena indigotica]KAF7311984.1 Nitrilase-like protein [Mycena indigotica]